MMYAIEETPKRCPDCNSDISKVRQSYNVTRPKAEVRRKRVCCNCGTEYYTSTPLDQRFI